ncbi:hypothetical protein FB45DRAFT_898406 [Roridomyces roridus]|uniref:SnoaL-like domain-containing protein n=1 Tax=Roridomyces roridus TaxID=1738132 RepID=A0AAD7FV96_9AGAR|nr:hypothetical protein FB45DRAFT_898406 [Roridomyces roridus]
MSKFTLTKAHIASLLDPVSLSSNWAPFVSAIDPGVRWVIGGETTHPTRKTGVYNLAGWKQDVNQPLLARLKTGLKMTVSSVEVIGNKAVVEAHGEATQANGRPYNNRYAWFLIFSEETGKIVEIREYLDTALVQEVQETN